MNNSLLNTSLKKVRRGRLSSTYVETYGRGLGDLSIDVSVKKDSLLVHVLKFFGISAGRCRSVVVRERD